jgi:inner membrane protein
VDNLTHSLVGATLAELALPRHVARPVRGVFLATGVIAANLPDADLLYTRITPPPLGYLLHHRGHTHTVVGALALGAVMAGVCALPWVRERVGGLRARFWALLGVALLSHLVLDAWNSYGVHPFWPVDSRWYYGDAVFIVEPWLWTLLGVTVAMNAVRRAWRVLLGLVLALVPVLATWRHVVPVPALLALALAGGGMWLLVRRASPHARAIAGLVAGALFVGASFGASAVARGKVLAAVRVPAGGAVVDVVLSPAAANPLCWSVLAIVRDAAADTYAISRGSATVLTREACGRGRRPGVVWEGTDVQSLARLRTLAATDCWVRAWLQFARAPALHGDEVADLRFGREGRGTFTTMRTAGGAARGCPAYLTAWRPPRAELLSAKGEPARRLRMSTRGELPRVAALHVTHDEVRGAPELHVRPGAVSHRHDTAVAKLVAPQLAVEPGRLHRVAHPRDRVVQLAAVRGERRIARGGTFGGPTHRAEEEEIVLAPPDHARAVVAVALEVAPHRR